MVSHIFLFGFCCFIVVLTLRLSVVLTGFFVVFFCGVLFSANGGESCFLNGLM